VRAPAALAVVAVAALAGCGGGGGEQGTGSGRTLHVFLRDEGCSPVRLAARSGRVTFRVSNGGTARVTGLALQDQRGAFLIERGNIGSGRSATFTLRLQPGRYRLNCLHSRAPYNAELVVTGKRLAGGGPGPLPALLAEAGSGYRRYVLGQTAALLRSTRRFVAALRAGDLERAKTLYGPTRTHYEAVEPVSESFGDLDPRIDARVNDVAVRAEWRGFHRIEQILWAGGTTAGTGAYGRELLADVAELHRRAARIDYQPVRLAAGAVELLNEIAASKVTGEEDRYSHTDLSDFHANLAGARVAFGLLRPALRATGHAALAATIAGRFAAVEETLDRYRRTIPLGYAPYDELTSADRRTLAQRIDALAEPLSTLAAIVNGG
jgi:iron uptake system component EfeO